MRERKEKLQILKEKGKITNFEREEKVQISKAFSSKLGYFTVFCLNCLNSIEVTSIHICSIFLLHTPWFQFLIRNNVTDKCNNQIRGERIVF